MAAPTYEDVIGGDGSDSSGDSNGQPHIDDSEDEEELDKQVLLLQLCLGIWHCSLAVHVS